MSVSILNWTRSQLVLNLLPITSSSFCFCLKFSDKSPFGLEGITSFWWDTFSSCCSSSATQTSRRYYHWHWVLSFGPKAFRVLVASRIKVRYSYLPTYLRAMMAPNPSSGNDISRTHSVNKSDRDLRDLDSIDAIDIETGKSIPWPVRRPSAELTRSDHIKIWTQLTIFAVALLAGGCTYSLLSPFYTKEATAKGLSVSQTGVVIISSIENITLFTLPFEPL